MEPLHVALILSTLLCSLVAGIAFTFATVAMPGLGTLDDRAFLHAFQVIDRVIQNNQPAFMGVWVGSALSLIATAVLGFRQLEGANLWILLAATGIYLLGVQMPTGLGNVPLNNQLQTVNVQVADETALAEARAAFEPSWNRWNTLRTVLGVVSSVLLLVLILRL